MNDDRYRFRKTGWLNWTPIRWEGWVATAVFVGFMCVTGAALERSSSSLWFRFSFIIACTVGFLYLVVKTTDPQA